MIPTKHGPNPKVAILIQAHRVPQDLQRMKKRNRKKGGPGESTKEKKLKRGAQISSTNLKEGVGHGQQKEKR